QDLKHIRAIHARFGEKRLQTFPMFSSWQWHSTRLFNRTKYVMPLNEFHFQKGAAEAELISELGW
ncbi:MAG: N-acetyl sugar amidotransferase, partial [SAR324 cluster bacterium]|nr:N-acetyl sugar amidotransferase [SAR324 cluster bacterium]